VAKKRQKNAEGDTPDPMLEQVVVAGEADDGRPCLDDLLDQASPDLEPAPTCCDDVAFWLYSSGSTGAPKGVKHLHRHLRVTSELYAKQVLGIQEDDVIFSAAKLFFASGQPMKVDVSESRWHGRDRVERGLRRPGHRSPRPSAFFWCFFATRQDFGPPYRNFPMRPWHLNTETGTPLPK
jgi:hypothetical protein